MQPEPVNNTPVPEPDDQIKALRSMALTVTPEELGLVPTPALPHVWGIVIDIGHAEVLATLVAMADGTTSLYLGHGGGFMGAGQHPRVRRATGRLLQQAEAMQEHFAPTTAYAFPNVGQVAFYVRTHAGVVAAEGTEADLVSGHDRLADLYRAAQAVITEIRLIDEEREE